MGRPLDPAQIESMATFRQWLVTEAVRAGGIGPNETDRVDARHISDSLLFSRFIADTGEVWDLGSGVGLPGIPLAILLPSVDFVLIDRSARRVDLITRAIRVLQLENVEVRLGEIAALRGDVEHIVSRASLSPERLTTPVRTLLRPGGVAVVGGSWRKPLMAEGWITEEVRVDALDRAVWFLMMRQQ